MATSDEGLAQGQRKQAEKHAEATRAEWTLRQHGAVAYRVALLVCRSKALAERAAQEALVDALDREVETADMRAWVIALARKKALNLLRRAALRLALAIACSSTWSSGMRGVCGDTPDEVVARPPCLREVQTSPDAAAAERLLSCGAGHSRSHELS